MSTESEDGDPPVRERARERSVSDVAREAFESRLIEGDDPKRGHHPKTER